MKVKALAIAYLLCAAIGAAQDTPDKAAAPNFNISGVVVSSIRGQALSRVKVMIAATTRRNEVLTMTTGEDGRFLFENLAPGKYSLDAERAGYSFQGFNQHDAYETAIAVGPNKESGNLVFLLKPDCAISGKVTDEQSEPVRDGQVMLFEKGLDNGLIKTANRGSTRLTDQGGYRFGHLRPGTYFVVVSAKPWYAQYQNSSSEKAINDTASPLDVAYPITYYPGTTEADSALPITLHAGDNLIADLALTPVAALHIRMNRQTADPSQAVSPMLMPQIFGTVQGVPANMQTTSSGSGNGTMVEEIIGIAPGQYDLQIHTFNRQGGGMPQRSQRRSVNFTKDGTLEMEDLAPVANVSGVVKFDGGINPERAAIQFRDSDSSPFLGAQLSNKGEFDQIPMSPGKYQVLMANNAGFNIVGISATGANVRGRTIEITEPGPVRLTVAASRGVGQIDGIAMRDNKPAPGVMIVLVPQDPANNTPLFRRDQSDSDGTFTLPQVLPGKYTALAIASGWELEWASPSTLAPYMAKGEVLRIEAGMKLNLKLNVQ